MFKELFIAISFTSCLVTLVSFNFRKIYFKQFHLKQCVILIDRVDYHFNEKINVVNFTLQNDGVHDTVINFCAETFAVIEKMIGHVRITTPMDDDDKIYAKPFFSTSVDVSKLLKGVQGNFVLKVFLENFFKSIDFEPKLPMKKVRFT